MYVLCFLCFSPWLSCFFILQVSIQQPWRPEGTHQPEVHQKGWFCVQKPPRLFTLWVLFSFEVTFVSRLWHFWMNQQLWVLFVWVFLKKPFQHNKSLKFSFFPLKWAFHIYFEILYCAISSWNKSLSPFSPKLLIKVLFPTRINELRHLICA